MSRSNKKKGSILLNRGIDVSTPAEYIDDSSLRKSINFEIKRNIISKRSGEKEIGSKNATTPTEIMLGRSFNREGTDYNIRIGLVNVEKYSSITDSWTDLGATLTGTTSDICSSAIPLLTGKRILCFTNGIDAIKKWVGSGTVADLGGTPPKAKFIQEYKTYLVCANIMGGTDITQRVQWSDTADPETWTGGNSGAVDLIEDGDDITGLSIFGNYLSVHKKNSIYLGYPVSSSKVFQFDRKSTGAGTIANNSIINLPTGEQIFLASDGIRVFNGMSAPLIKSPINDEIRDELSSEYGYKSFSILVKNKDEVWISVPLTGQTTSDTVYKFNYKTRTLYKDSRTNSTAMWLGSQSASKTWDDYVAGETWDSVSGRWNDGTLTAGAEQINIGHLDGSVTIVDESAKSDNGSDINSYFVTKDFQDSQQGVVRWNSMEMWGRGGSLSVEYSIDGGDTWVQVSNSPITLSTTFPTYDNTQKLWFDVVSSKIRFKFINNSSTDSLSIKQFVIDYIPRGLR